MIGRWWKTAFLAALLAATASATSQRVSWQEDAALRDSLSRVHPRMRASWLKERGIRDEYWQGCVRPVDSGLRCVGRWSFGPSYDVDGRVTPTETLVALARGSGVSLIRFARTDSIELEPLADVNAGGLMKRVAVRDSLLYVGSTTGLEIWSIANERNPRQLSWLHTALNDFDVQDSFAYIIGPDDSFKVYNVANPANPVFRGACRDSGDLVSVAGNAAFVGDRWGLYVVDITNPSAPHRIGSWGSAIEQVLARGRLCYVTTFNPNQPGEITFHVLDVTAPSSPAQIGSRDSAGGLDVHLVDTLAFCSGDNDMDKFRIVSVADSTRPRIIGSVGSGGWGFGIWASGLAQSAFVGAHYQGLQVFDTRNTSQPGWDTSLLGVDQSVDISIDHGRAYVANEMAGLKILDIIDPTRPTFLGSYDTGGQRPFMGSAAARDSFAFISWSRPKFRSLDVSNPAAPIFAGTCELFGYPEDMVIRDSFVYCAEANRFQIVNVARPREPALVGSCSGDGVSIVLRDTFAYTAAGAIRVTNIARPDSPFVVTTIGRSSWDLSIADSMLFCQPGPAIWYSLANPAVPVPIDSIDMGHWINGMTAVNRTIYACSGPSYATMYAISVADLHQPRVIDQTSLPYTARRVTYVAPYVYAAIWEAGVAIYETTATGIAERELTERPGGSQLRAVPNPASNKVRLLGVSRHTALALFDAAGRATHVTAAGAKEDEVEFDMAGLAPGVYFVRSTDNPEMEVLTIVKP